MTSRQRMVMEDRSPATTPARDAPSETRWTELAGAMEREASLAGEIRETLVRQRAGVSRNQREQVNASCDDLSRLLRALDTVRRHRAGLLEALTGRPDPAWDALEQRAPAAGRAALASARARLRSAAESVHHEATTNREVLRRSMESGAAFLQALFSTTTGPETTYRPSEPRDDGEPGFLVDRKA